MSDDPYLPGLGAPLDGPVAVRPDEPRPRFNGPAYEPVHDDVRLTGQLLRVYMLMKDGEWRTLNEISKETRDPPASISAQLRHLRKPRFGRYCVERRARGERSCGLWEYRVLPPLEEGT
jgi:hypothetical protein